MMPREAARWLLSLAVIGDNELFGAGDVVIFVDALWPGGDNILGKFVISCSLSSSWNVAVTWP